MKRVMRWASVIVLAVLFSRFLVQCYGPRGALIMIGCISVALVIQGLVETIVHESGHVLCAYLFGIPLTGVEIGFGPRITLWRHSNCPFKLGVFPFGGHVDFPYLPLSRHSRIVMYAGGMLATAVATVIVTIALPPGLKWLRLEIVSLSVLFILVNLFGRAPVGRWSDGDAIRGLLSYQ